MQFIAQYLNIWTRAKEETINKLNIDLSISIISYQFRRWAKYDRKRSIA